MQIFLLSLRRSFYLLLKAWLECKSAATEAAAQKSAVVMRSAFADEVEAALSVRWASIITAVLAFWAQKSRIGYAHHAEIIPIYFIIAQRIFRDASLLFRQNEFYFLRKHIFIGVRLIHPNVLYI